MATSDQIIWTALENHLDSTSQAYDSLSEVQEIIEAMIPRATTAARAKELAKMTAEILGSHMEECSEDDLVAITSLAKNVRGALCETKDAVRRMDKLIAKALSVAAEEMEEAA